MARPGAELQGEKLIKDTGAKKLPIQVQKQGDSAGMWRWEGCYERPEELTGV